MVSVRVWQPSVAAACSPAVVQKAVSASLPSSTLSPRQPMSGVTLITLKKRDEFVALSKKGSHARSHTLILQALKSDRIPPAVRFGITVSGKVGNAVVRNRIKRRFRSAIGAVLKEQGKPGVDYVLVGRNNAMDAPFETIVRDLNYTLAKVHTMLGF
ncbi:MAG: ribonuclease P protein component [Proteobacteria bacterium]|nr:ribonuclease P protein component [Pseudomonadota bacterium]